MSSSPAATENKPTTESAAAALREAALAYHEFPTRGKLCITATKALTNQRDLALAYSPGVAAPCEAIVKDPSAVSRYTARGNLVGVVTNGTAVLGLGAIGPLAGKPVMEGKAVLFKKFAGIDVFDIEIEERDPDKLVEIIASLEPTFGGINLEDIKAPECFYVERKLRERMKIPVFHDDQHGTAIITAAAVLNGLTIVGKDIRDIKVAVSGAGAAAIACVDLLVDLGLPTRNVWLTDSTGVVYEGRKEKMDPDKARYAQATGQRTLGEVMKGADLFLGLSAAGLVKPDMVAAMAARPLVFAMANPVPEILPEEVHKVRDDAIVATGRSDYPNQVNNVLCFPFMFRGALDAGATTITREMEIAAVHAIAGLARREQSDVVASAYNSRSLSFGAGYIIPKPFDPRLIVHVAPAVAEAAAKSGVATRPIKDLDQYREQLQQFVYHSSSIMRPVFNAARAVPRERGRLIFAEGEEERVLRAAQVLVDERVAHPVLVGRREVILQRLERYGLRLAEGEQITIVNSDRDPRYREFWQEYRRLMGRRGVTEQYARLEVRRRTTLIAALLLKSGDGDGMLCGTISSPQRHLEYIDPIIGKKPGSTVYAAMSALMLPDRQLFLVDTHINLDPSAEQLAEIALAAACEVRRFGIEPKLALLSHSNFGSSDTPSAQKMRKVRELLRERAPELELDGEMSGECALSPAQRRAILPDSTLNGPANLLVFPGLDAAHIACSLLKVAASNNVVVGPILLGSAAPVNVLTPSITVRGIVNMAALTIAESGVPALRTARPG